MVRVIHHAVNGRKAFDLCEVGGECGEILIRSLDAAGHHHRPRPRLPTDLVLADHLFEELGFRLFERFQWRRTFYLTHLQSHPVPVARFRAPVTLALPAALELLQNSRGLPIQTKNK